MTRKILIQGLLIMTILLASFASAGDVQAGGYCGNTYTVQWGDTLSKIAQSCGTSVAALYAANPWLGYYIYAGQVLVMPGGGYTPPGGYSGSYSNTYIVQYGDTFANIANRYGVSVYTLWAANPHIWNINYIYAGQVVYVPGSSYSASSSSGSTSTTSSSDSSADLSWGVVPASTQTGRFRITNNANSEAYISLQGTTNEGVHFIKEYWVSKTIKVNTPVAWYVYVVWVGGKKYSGQFQLHSDETIDISIYSHKVTVD